MESAGAKKATIASNGTISRSSNSKIEIMRCPRGAIISCRSLNTYITTITGKVGTKPEAETNDTHHEKPKAILTNVSSARRRSVPACRPARIFGCATPTNARTSFSTQ